MKKKINIQFLLIAFLAIAATWVFAAVVFYEVVCREIMDDLKGYAKLLAAAQRLLNLVKGIDGMTNKDMNKFADQINSLCDKWK